MDRSQQDELLRALNPVEALTALTQRSSEGGGPVVHIHYTIIMNPVIHAGGSRVEEQDPAAAVLVLESTQEPQPPPPTLPSPPGDGDSDGATDIDVTPISTRKSPRTTTSRRRSPVPADPSTYNISEEDAKSIEVPLSARAMFEKEYYGPVRERHRNKNEGVTPTDEEMKRYFDDGWNNNSHQQSNYTREYRTALAKHKRSLTAFRKKYPGWLEKNYSPPPPPPPPQEEEEEAKDQDDDDDAICRLRKEYPRTVAALETPRPPSSEAAKGGKKKVKREGPKGANTAYVHFTTATRAKYNKMPEYSGMRATELTTIIAKHWNEIKCDSELLKPYQGMEAADRERYNAEWYEYMKAKPWKWIEWKITQAHRKSWRTWKTKNAERWAEWKQQVPDAEAIDDETSEGKLLPIPRSLFEGPPPSSSLTGNKRPLEEEDEGAVESSPPPPPKRRRTEPVVSAGSSILITDQKDLPSKGRSLPVQKVVPSDSDSDDDDDDDDVTTMWDLKPPPPPKKRRAPKGRRGRMTRNTKRARGTDEEEEEEEVPMMEIEDEFMESFDYGGVE